MRIMKEVAGQQKVIKKLRQQRKVVNGSNFLGGRNPNMPSQGKPDGPNDRLAITALW
jgi:hypothetical protein